MGMREWVLLGATIVVPLAVAVVVTLWTLEQAIKRNAKNRGGKQVRRVAAAVEANDADLAVSPATADDQGGGAGDQAGSVGPGEGVGDRGGSDDLNPDGSSRGSGD